MASSADPQETCLCCEALFTPYLPEQAFCLGCRGAELELDQADFAAWGREYLGRHSDRAGNPDRAALPGPAHPAGGIVPHFGL